MDAEVAWALGAVLALLATVGFAAQLICIRAGTRNGRVIDAVLISLSVNVLLLAPLTVVLHPVHPSELFTPLSFVSFALAGVSGSLLGRLFTFKGVKALGANLTSPILSANVFFATAFAIVFLGESISAIHGIGIVLIVAGVTIISRESAEDNRDKPLRTVAKLITYPLLAALCLGIEPIFISTGFSEGTPVVPGLAVNMFAATLGFLGYMFATGSLSSMVLSPRMVAWYVGAGVATTAAFLLYFSALEIAPVVLVMPILQVTPLFVIILSWLILPRALERLTIPLVFGALVVVTGAALVSLSGI